MLVQRHRYVQAREQIGWLTQADPTDFDYRTLAATIAVGLGEHDAAIALYEVLLAERPDDADMHLWMAHALKTVGPAGEAIDAYRMAASPAAELRRRLLEPRQPEALPFRGGRDRHHARRGGRTRRQTPVDREHLCFALGKALEDQGETAQAWRYYERGNALKRD